jgi:hypothetical protein
MILQIKIKIKNKKKNKNMRSDLIRSDWIFFFTTNTIVVLCVIEVWGKGHSLIKMHTNTIVI